MSVKVSMQEEKISNQTTMGKRLERSGEVRIADETNGFKLDLIDELGLKFLHSLSCSSYDQHILDKKI